jgi:hypothetical protein
LLVKNTGLTPEFQGVDEDNGRALKITRNPLSSTKHDNGSEEQPMNKAEILSGKNPMIFLCS